MMLCANCHRAHDVRRHPPGHHAFTCECGKIFAFTVRPPPAPSRWNLLEVD